MRHKNRRLRHSQNMLKIENGTLPDPDKLRAARRVSTRDARAARKARRQEMDDMDIAINSLGKPKAGKFGQMMGKVKRLFRRKV